MPSLSLIDANHLKIQECLNQEIFWAKTIFRKFSKFSHNALPLKGAVFRVATVIGKPNSAYGSQEPWKGPRTRGKVEASFLSSPINIFERASTLGVDSTYTMKIDWVSPF